MSNVSNEAMELYGLLKVLEAYKMSGISNMSMSGYPDLVDLEVYKMFGVSYFINICLGLYRRYNE